MCSYCWIIATDLNHFKKIAIWAMQKKCEGEVSEFKVRIVYIRRKLGAWV